MKTLSLRGLIASTILPLFLSILVFFSLRAEPDQINQKAGRRCTPQLDAANFESPPGLFNPALLGNVVNDGGFEQGAGSGAWQDSSTNFGTPICNPNLCGGGGNLGPHQGNWWCWFGGIDTADETGIVEQDIRIPFEADTLSFWFWIPTARTPGNFQAEIDGDVLFQVTEADSQYYGGYTRIAIDIRAYADTLVHHLKFTGSTTAGDITNFFLDDVFIDDGQEPTGIDPVAGDIRQFVLQQNFPNPFNPTTNIQFVLRRTEEVTLTVYDLRGREITTLVQNRLSAGTHQVEWNGRDSNGFPVASGIYLYRLQAGNSAVQTRKMVLLK